MDEDLYTQLKSSLTMSGGDFYITTRVKDKNRALQFFVQMTATGDFTALKMRVYWDNYGWKSWRQIQLV